MSLGQAVGSIVKIIKTDEQLAIKLIVQQSLNNVAYSIYFVKENKSIKLSLDAFC